MAQNVRVAQIGQLGINRPIWEVVGKDGKRYAFSCDKTGRVVFRNPAYLKAIGVYAVVADNFERQPTSDIKAFLNLDSNNSCTRDDKFSAIQLGTGFAFVNAWNITVGWITGFPTLFTVYN